MTDNPPAGDQERQADISDAHHEGFGAGVAWADQTPGTGDGVEFECPNCEEYSLNGRAVARIDAAAIAAGCESPLVTLRQSLTEAEASHQAELGRLQLRIAELEHAITQYLDSHGTAGTGVLGKRLKAAVGRVE